MSMETAARAAQEPMGSVHEQPATTLALKPAWSFREVFSLRNMSALYVLLGIIVLFSVWAPETFPTMATVKQVLNNNAVIGLAALALAVPLSAGVFDLSFAYVMSLAGVTTAYLVATLDWPVSAAVVAALTVALLVGFINAYVVVILKVDSMIGTLATGSIIQAFITFVTSDINITDSKLTGGFSGIGQVDVGGITLPAFYVLAVAIGLWFLLEHTALGRRIYAAGFNAEAARLSGIRVRRIRFCSLLVSSLIAGWAGVCLASILSTGSPTAGTAYLLPAFAAAFLGATQVKAGRFNAWGTLLGVVALGTGTTGLALAAAPGWASNMFTGLVLITALAFNVRQGKLQTLRSGRARRRTGIKK